MAQLGSSWTHLGLPTLTKGSVQKPPQRSRLKGGGAGDRPVGVLDNDDDGDGDDDDDDDAVGW